MLSFPAPLDQLADVARQAGELAKSIRTELRVEVKPDGSLVTNADRAVEMFLRSELPKILPHSAFWGEEFGRESEGPGGLWIVDPIDGTSNFRFGSPLWAVSIGHSKNNVLTHAAVFLPDLDELYVAKKGCGAFMNGTPLPALPKGKVLPNDLISIASSLWQRRVELPGNPRTIGSVVLEGVWVSSGKLRGIIGKREALYDVAAAVLIAEEIGADVRYADGTPFVIKDLMDGKQIQKPWLIFPKDSGFTLPE